jgi:hypothetical protein
VALPPQPDAFPLQNPLAAWRPRFLPVDAKRLPEWMQAPQQWEAPVVWAEGSCAVRDEAAMQPLVLRQPRSGLRAQAWRALAPKKRAPEHGFAERPALPSF